MNINDGRDDLPELYWNKVYAPKCREGGLPQDIIDACRTAFNRAINDHPETWEFFQARMERLLTFDNFDVARAYAAGTLTGIRDLGILRKMREE